MRIGFDAKRAFHNRTGLGNYSRTLLWNLKKYFPEDEYILFSPGTKKNFPELSANFEVVTPNSKNPLWRSFGIKKDIDTKNIDIFHGLSNELPFGIDKLQIASVVTIHDVIFESVPQDFSFFDRQVFRTKTVKCIRETDLIIAISQATKEALINHYSVPESKIEVVYQPHDPIFDSSPLRQEYQTELKKSLQLPDDFVLYVGSVMKRKNTMRLIHGWEQMNTDIPLLIFGGGNKFRKKVQNYIVDNNLTPKVQLRNPVSFNLLPGLYKMASTVIYPSTIEGFGLPVLEALACGAKVVTSEISSMPEAGGAHCTYIDPFDTQSIAHGLDESLNNFRHDRKGLSLHLERFNSKVLTEKVHNIYKNLPNF
ncbi:glycosyltransferase family 4 protein [Membranihabitans maritimus]|uniref:glycosyltransferase family 4 protein n=1 Tax=Membranihabitans maritimus TaxID=2904244 RepID=UPI001F2D6532|nr:glycosyltransferase family 1 protein [Membranihabitans maritimus]